MTGQNEHVPDQSTQQAGGYAALATHSRRRGTSGS